MTYGKKNHGTLNMRTPAAPPAGKKPIGPQIVSLIHIPLLKPLTVSFRQTHDKVRDTKTVCGFKPRRVFVLMLSDQPRK